MQIGIARSCLDSKHYSAIDNILKDLRLASQRLADNSSYFRDELILLERLYYKNLNQHRTAVFWRRIVEVRRLGRRIYDASISDMVDSLRYSFFSENGERRLVMSKS